MLLYHSCPTFNWDHIHITVLEGFKGSSPSDALKELTDLVSSCCSALLPYLTQDFMAIFSLIEECPSKGLMTLFIIKMPVHGQKKILQRKKTGKKLIGTKNYFWQLKFCSILLICSLYLVYLLIWSITRSFSFSHLETNGQNHVYFHWISIISFSNPTKMTLIPRGGNVFTVD